MATHARNHRYEIMSLIQRASSNAEKLHDLVPHGHDRLGRLKPPAVFAAFLTSRHLSWEGRH